MASLTDLITTGSSAPLGFSMATAVPQYRLNETLPALQEDAAIGTSRALQNYGDRQLPTMMNQGAAMGQTGGTGLRQRADWLGQDTGRQVTDIQRMLARSTANIAQQKVMATFGNVFG